MQFQEISIPTQGRLTEIPSGRGFQSTIFWRKVMYMYGILTPLEISETCYQTATRNNWITYQTWNIVNPLTPVPAMTGYDECVLLFQFWWMWKMDNAWVQNHRGYTADLHICNRQLKLDKLLLQPELGNLRRMIFPHLTKVLPSSHSTLTLLLPGLLAPNTVPSLDSSLSTHRPPMRSPESIPPITAKAGKTQ